MHSAKCIELDKIDRCRCNFGASKFREKVFLNLQHSGSIRENEIGLQILIISVGPGNELPGYPEILGRGYPAWNRFFEICHYPDPAQNQVLLPRGYPGN